MTTSLLTSLMRLGAAIFGSNEDLETPDSQKGNDSGDGENEDENEDSEESEGEGSGSGDDSDSDDSDSKSKGSDESDEDSEDSDDGSDQDSADSDDESDQDSEDQDSEDEDSEDQDSEDQDSGSDEDTDKTDDSESGDSESGDKTAGGHHDAGEFAEAMLDGLLAPTEHILDGNDALEQAVDKCRDEDDDCGANEAVWRPYDASQDVVLKPTGNRAMAEVMRKKAAVLTAALRTQFRRRFLAAKNPRVQHGVKRGRGLSEERLVESYVEILSGQEPSRPDYRVTSQQDVSLALAVVIDQSGSMQGREQHAAGVAALALAESFDSLNAPVMCCGPRNGGRGTRGPTSYDEDNGFSDSHTGQQEYALNSVVYHRTDRVAIDLFMDWDESFKQCKHRFAAVQATGSTPLSDGIQFALQELSNRPERHRVIVVLTDGCPDNARVVTRQIRLAKEAGITVIGVGIDGAEYYVPALFPDHHIVVEDLTELPKRMMEVVGAIVFPKGAKKASLDGRLGTSKQRRRA